MDMQQRENGAPMGADGEGRDAGEAGNLLAGQAAGHVLGNLLLSWTKKPPVRGEARLGDRSSAIAAA
jgi:hypothetical protein